MAAEPKFTVQKIEHTIDFEEDGEDYVEDYDEGPVEPADFQQALDALNSDCWDNIDDRFDGTIICYPADSRMNMHTGVYEETQVIIRARRPDWSERLMIAYHLQEKKRNEARAGN